MCVSESVAHYQSFQRRSNQHQNKSSTEKRQGTLPGQPLPPATIIATGYPLVGEEGFRMFFSAEPVEHSSDLEAK